MIYLEFYTEELSVRSIYNHYSRFSVTYILQISPHGRRKSQLSVTNKSLMSMSICSSNKMEVVLKSDICNEVETLQHSDSDVDEATDYSKVFGMIFLFMIF